MTSSDLIAAGHRFFTSENIANLVHIGASEHVQQTLKEACDELLQGSIESDAVHVPSELADHRR